VVRGIQGVAYQDGIAARGIQLAVGLVGDVVGGQLGAAAQLDRRFEMRRLREDRTDRGWIVGSVQVRLFSGIF
jgi:hypothetical protein